jgi:hypothetical protein
VLLSPGLIGVLSTTSTTRPRVDELQTPSPAPFITIILKYTHAHTNSAWHSTGVRSGVEVGGNPRTRLSVTLDQKSKNLHACDMQCTSGC